MAARHLRTSQIAKDLGVHVNTIRLYEADGLLPTIPRAPNGYRQYTTMRLEQARLAHLLTALDVPREDEEIQTIADRWLSTLLELEQRAQAMIRQIGHMMIEMTHCQYCCAVLPLKPSNTTPPPYSGNEQSCIGRLAACEVV